MNYNCVNRPSYLPVPALWFPPTHFCIVWQPTWQMRVKSRPSGVLCGRYRKPKDLTSSSKGIHNKFKQVSHLGHSVLKCLR